MLGSRSRKAKSVISLRCCIVTASCKARSASGRFWQPRQRQQRSPEDLAPHGIEASAPACGRQLPSPSSRTRSRRCQGSKEQQRATNLILLSSVFGGASRCFRQLIGLLRSDCRRDVL